MAEDQDPSQKTEEPTSKRLSDAEQKGQVAKSTEVGHWFMILGVTIALMIFSTGIATDLRRSMLTFIEQPHAIPLDGKHLQVVMWDMLGGIGMALAPLLILLMLAGLVGNLIQHKPILSAHKLKPELSKLSLIKGMKRLFSGNALFEFAKGILKITIIGVVAAVVVWPELDELPLTITYDIKALLPMLRELALIMMAGVLSVMTIIAMADIVYQRYKHNQSLRMTKQEVKDENKQSEGDPQVKQRLRAIRMERARQRMMSAVPEADVVVTNPTHYAVALKYDQESMAAPKLVAKGQDLVAARIREVAEENRVPIVPNPPLARTLYATVELDQEIPVEHYKAVAEIIGYVMRLRKSLPPRPAGGRATTP